MKPRFWPRIIKPQSLILPYLTVPAISSLDIDRCSMGGGGYRREDVDDEEMQSCDVVETENYLPDSFMLQLCYKASTKVTQTIFLSCPQKKTQKSKPKAPSCFTPISKVASEIVNWWESRSIAKNKQTIKAPWAKLQVLFMLHIYFNIANPTPAPIGGRTLALKKIQQLQRISF